MASMEALISQRPRPARPALVLVSRQPVVGALGFFIACSLRFKSPRFRAQLRVDKVLRRFEHLDC